MTHDGPAGNKTSHMFEEPHGHLEFGSRILADYLKDNADQVLLCLHGHCHGGAQSDLETLPVPSYNPGPLIAGHFAIMELSRTDGKWKVSDYKAF